jgi:hypothetical protein
MKVKNSTMQAFPFIEPQENENIKAYHPGMTMRDEFAKAAMLSMLTHYDPASSFDEDEINVPESMPFLIARDAYIMADFMMKARK